MDDHNDNVVQFEQPDKIILNIDRIVLATDGSSGSMAATLYAIALAKSLNAKLKAIFVEAGEDENPYDVFKASSGVDEQGPTSAGLTVAQLYAQENNIDLETEIVRGNIVDCISSAVRSFNADLLIVGNTGRTGIRRLAYGSITEAVVRESQIPVLVLKGD